LLPNFCHQSFMKRDAGPGLSSALRVVRRLRGARFEERHNYFIDWRLPGPPPPLGPGTPQGGAAAAEGSGRCDGRGDGRG